MKALLDLVLPFWMERTEISTYRARLEQRRAEHAKGNSLYPEWRKFRELSLADLKESLRCDLTRRDVIHRRALTYLGSVAVLSAFTLGVTRVLSEQSGPAFAANSLTAALVIVFLGGAAWSALRIVGPEDVYDLFLPIRVPADHPLSEAELKDEIIFFIHMNQAHNLIFNKYSLRADRCLRNGLISLLLVAIGSLYVNT